MIRLILFIVIFAVFLAFIIFNLDNKCDISFKVIAFKDVPIFLSIFVSFVMGMLITLPMIFTFGRKRKKRAAAEHPNKLIQENSSGTDENKKEKSPYGID